jgi:cell fate regulator YaaT (PSP1 superfamily)
MAVYQVQLENQARPVFVRHEGPPLPPRSACLVETEWGPSLGQVLENRTFLEAALPPASVLKLLRPATDEDRKRRQKHRQIEKEALITCRYQVRTLNLPMKVVLAHMVFDESRLVFFFTAENRVDFRELVRNLAHRFHTRIEMRQVGVRDEAKILGGFGHCGRPLCCTAHLPQFYPITIRMAKDQGLSLNPAKISGRCGRLMCCLRYECPRNGRKEAPPPPEA